MNLPTPGRVVLIQLHEQPDIAARPMAPAIVLGANENGTIDVVAFAAHWPLSPGHLMRNVAHVDAAKLGGAGPWWFWPPRAPEPSSAELSHVKAPAAVELEREQRALAAALAAAVTRLDELEARLEGWVGELPG